MLPAQAKTVTIGLLALLATIFVFSTEVQYWQLLLSPHTKHSQPIPIISSRPESIKEMTFAVQQLQLEPEATEAAELLAMALLRLTATAVYLKLSAYLLMCQAVFLMTPTMITSEEVVVTTIACAPQKFPELIHDGLEWCLVITRRASKSALPIEEAQVVVELEQPESALIVILQVGLASTFGAMITVMASMMATVVMLVSQMVQVQPQMVRWATTDCIREKGIPLAQVLSTATTTTTKVIRPWVDSIMVEYTMFIRVQLWSTVQSTAFIAVIAVIEVEPQSMVQNTAVIRVEPIDQRITIKVGEAAYMEQAITTISVEAAFVRRDKQWHTLSFTVVMRACKPTQACTELVAARVQLQLSKQYEQVRFWFAMDSQQSFELEPTIVSQQSLELE